MPEILRHVYQNLLLNAEAIMCAATKYNKKQNTVYTENTQILAKVTTI